MDILIKGMEMPKSPVLFCIHPDGKVFADLEGGWREYQAVPVPEHGRLIDADALTNAIESTDWYHQAPNKEMVHGANSAGHQAWYKEQDVYSAIDNAPTIIPAEDEHTMEEFMYGQEGNLNDGSM